MPGGRCFPSCYNADYYGYWWAAMEYGRGYDAYLRGMLYGYEGVNEYGGGKSYGFSVRCVRDKNAADASSQKSVGDDMVKVEMVFVKGGTFMMGCTSEQGIDCADNEKSAHSVTVGDFYIGKYEVTQGLWKAVMGDSNNPSYFTRNDKLPVEYVSWKDIAGKDGFIEILNNITGKKYRLPTEAEWEYAARGGASSKGYKYSGSNNFSSVAWYWNNIPSQSSGNPGYGTQPVGTKYANELKLYDITGNVWEWVSDWYGDYSAEAQTNPTGPRSGTCRVLRGCCWNWNIDVRYYRVSLRAFDYPDNKDDNIGFRLALSP